ncbi:MAG: glycoside hydrolase family 127 protein [Propionibacteriaceae bacterium]|jgi:DUF1680 family protein|nr:glycoside hydrolase family 127 protein [Propionibacteriaceae bacterium]
MSYLDSPTSAVLAPVIPAHGRWSPLGLESVQLTDGYWAAWQVTNAAIIKHCDEFIERLGWLANFDKAAAGRLAEGRSGRQFSDSEIYKLLEGMAWEIGRTGDPDLEARFQAISARVAAAQDADGYISTMYGHDGQAPRYSDLTWGHELYCMGHLIQAGVARGRTAGMDDELTRVAIAAADHICREFGEGGRDGTCGHPEIEVALAELSRLTGDPRYRRQARVFIDRRGHGAHHSTAFDSSYYQDDMPVRQAAVLRGHAVRALYLQAGIVDQAVDDGDAELLDVATSQMRATLARRTYLTGGMGSRHEGEAFGEDWELPSDRAYCETCAGIASIMVNYRLLLASGQAQFADMVERTLFNVVAASPSVDGRSFFYANPLRQMVARDCSDSGDVSARSSTGARAPWFEVSCCPTNLTRIFASLAAYVASVDGAGIQLHQWADCEIKTTLPVGRVGLRVTTDYPHKGRITVTVLEAPSQPWTLSLRVPAWVDQSTEAATLASHDETRFVTAGYTHVTRAFRAGETVVLTLPMAARWTWPDRRIDDIRGSVAVERGPLVMAVESVDLGSDAAGVVVRTDAPPIDENGRVSVPISLLTSSDGGWPYGRRDEGQPGEERLVPMVRYQDWAGRGPSTMRVWLPTA